jgi:hypothetical protein
MTTFAQRIAIAAAAIAVIGTSAGCGEQMAEQIGGEIVDGQVEIDDDSVSITDDEGNEFAAGGGATIPESWPADVPLFPSGDLALATSQSDGTATALWETQSPVNEAADGYDAVLREQGFTLDQDSTIAGAVVRAYTGELHAVNLTLARIDGMTNVTVAVVPR